MSDAVYKLLSGSLATKRQFEATTSNVANSATIGFLPERVNIEANNRRTFTLPTAQSQPVLTPGPVHRTGAPLDIAPGDGAFLVVQTPQGERLTRAGALQQDRDGILVTSAGHPVLTESGQVASDRIIEIMPTGEVVSDKEILGRLRLELITDIHSIKREGNSLISVPESARFRLDQPRFDVGALIGSGVEPVAAMVEIVALSRAYEIYQQAIRTIHSTGGKTANLGRI